MLTDDDTLTLAIPRDRAGTFEPQLVPKHVRRLPDFDRKVLSLYARGMTVREIQAHLEELYEIAIAPSVISTQFERLHPVVLFDCLRVKIRSPSSSNCSVSASPVSRKPIPDLAHKIPYAPDYYT